MDILSIDIYFNKRIADFEKRLVESGMTELINNSNTTITTYLYNRHPYRHLKEIYLEIGLAKAKWANKWLESDLLEDAIYRDWEERWRWCVRVASMRYRSCISESAEREPNFDKDIFEKHQGLLKHESSVLIQMRIRKIGLKVFLYRRGISDMEISFYSCNQISETAANLAIEY